MNAKLYKVRASSAGSIIGAKPPKLLKGHQTIAQTWVKEQIYGVKKTFTSKYTDKGNLVEDSAIEYAIANAGLPLLCEKNEQFFEDDYFTGTPDIILDDEIIDIKSSWDCFTFPLFEKELPEKKYADQAQVYMHLTGKKKARIIYVLMNTPDEVAEWEDHHDYSNVLPEYRKKQYWIYYDPHRIEMLQKQVELIRNYIKTLER